jgi:hypothetical protein
MTTPKQQKAIDLYHALMSEARYRIDGLNFVLSGETKLAQAFLHEFCYLQLRMLCETIALGCLVAHGDIVEKQIKDFEKEWHAEKIIDKLGDLNPDFFPQQAVLTRNAHLLSLNANTNKNALTKDELPKLYKKCGGMLHRGTLRQISRPNQHLTYAKLNAPEIVNWAQKIEDLLGSHIIPLKATQEETVMLMCHLRSTAQNFQTTVQRVEMQRVKAPGPLPGLGAPLYGPRKV